MERKTTEITVTLRSDNIVVTKINDGITELSLEGVESVITATNAVHNVNNEPKAALMYMPTFYVKKDIVRGYASNRAVEVVAVAIVANSFASKIIGNLLLTMRSRVLKLTNEKIEPSKVFMNEESAVNWLLDHLENVKK